MPEYAPLKGDDKERMVQIATEVWRALDGKPMLDCWLALMLNVQRLGGVMLEKASTNEAKIQMHEYLAYTDRWIRTTNAARKN